VIDLTKVSNILKWDMMEQRSANFNTGKLIDLCLDFHLEIVILWSVVMTHCMQSTRNNGPTKGRPLLLTSNIVSPTDDTWPGA